MEGAALQSTSAELGEETLDGVEPEARGWREVEDETRMAIEPRADVGMLAYINAYNDKAEPFVWTKKKVRLRPFKGRRITQL